MLPLSDIPSNHFLTLNYVVASVSYRFARKFGGLLSPFSGWGKRAEPGRAAEA